MPPRKYKSYKNVPDKFTKNGINFVLGAQAFNKTIMIQRKEDLKKKWI